MNYHVRAEILPPTPKPANLTDALAHVAEAIVLARTHSDTMQRKLAAVRMELRAADAEARERALADKLRRAIWGA